MAVCWSWTRSERNCVMRAPISVLDGVPSSERSSGTISGGGLGACPVTDGTRAFWAKSQALSIKAAAMAAKALILFIVRPAPVQPPSPADRAVHSRSWILVSQLFGQESTGIPLRQVAHGAAERPRMPADFKDLAAAGRGWPRGVRTLARWGRVR